MPITHTHSEKRSGGGREKERATGGEGKKGGNGNGGTGSGSFPKRVCSRGASYSSHASTWKAVVGSTTCRWTAPNADCPLMLQRHAAPKNTWRSTIESIQRAFSLGIARMRFRVQTQQSKAQETKPTMAPPHLGGSQWGWHRQQG